jgi:hypothetical protein
MLEACSLRNRLRSAKTRPVCTALVVGITNHKLFLHNNNCAVVKFAICKVVHSKLSVLCPPLYQNKSLPLCWCCRGGGVMEGWKEEERRARRRSQGVQHLVSGGGACRLRPVISPPLALSVAANIKT